MKMQEIFDAWVKAKTRLEREQILFDACFPKGFKLRNGDENVEK